MPGKRVMIADNAGPMTSAVAARLRIAGYDVVTTDNGAAAVRLATNQSPDVVVTNYQLPGLSGIEMCQRLRQNENTASVPAVLLTARGYCVSADAADKAGIRRLLPRP